MSCHLCRFFFDPDRYKRDINWKLLGDPDSEYYARLGECRFNPVAVAKRYDDACGQFSPREPDDPGRFYQRMHEHSFTLRVEIAKRKDAERKLKELRAKLRGERPAKASAKPLPAQRSNGA